MDEFLTAVGLAALLFLVLSAIIAPILVFQCSDYVAFVEANTDELGQLALATGDDAKVWISNYGELRETAYWVVVNARNVGGEKDIAIWLNGYDYILFGALD